MNDKKNNSTLEMQMTEPEDLERVIAISRILSPTPVENNYWRNLIQKSLGDEPFSAYEAFELGRFAERMQTYSAEHSEYNSFHSCLSYKQDLQTKFNRQSNR